MKTKLTSKDVLELLRKKFAAPEYAFFSEVRGGTGARGSKFCDGLAISLWPSRGITIDGFEIKVSRGDLRRELSNPAKADEIQKFCDRWWLVLSSADLLSEDDILPKNWGVMVVRGTTQLRVQRKPPERRPKALTRSFVASVLRRFQQCYVPIDELRELRQNQNEIVNERLNAHIEARREGDSYNLKAVRERLDALTHRVHEFERASGVSIDSWRWADAADMGRAVAQLIRTAVRRDGTADRIERIANQLEDAQRDVAALSSAVRAVMATEPTE